MKTTAFEIGDVKIGLDTDLFVIAGPCVIESTDACLDIAKQLSDIAAAVGIGIIFKASFDKANRSSVTSFRGPGLKKGLSVLAKVARQTSLPVMTDVRAGPGRRSRQSR